MRGRELREESDRQSVPEVRESDCMRVVGHGVKQEWRTEFFPTGLGMLITASILVRLSVAELPLLTNVTCADSRSTI
jgi:hypothetical protein